MRRVLWTAVLLGVAAVAMGANCLETAQEVVKEAATEVAEQQTVVAEQQSEEASDKGFTLVNGTWLPWGKEKRLFLDVVEILPPKFYADPAPLDTVERVGAITSPAGAWAKYVPEEGKIELAAFNAATEFSEDSLRAIYVHELAHVLQFYDPASGRQYESFSESQILREYGDAVGFFFTPIEGTRYEADDRRNPSEIPRSGRDPGASSLDSSCPGQKCIWEDMADAIGMYVVYPEYLKQLSTARYDFIRDEVFGGKEF